MDLVWPAQATWALPAAMALTLLAWYAVRNARRSDAEAALRRRRRALYDAAVKDWQTAINAKDMAAASRLAAMLEEMRARRWHMGGYLALCCLCLLLASCATRRPDPAPRPPIIGIDILSPAPGDTVPPLPDGAACWWLATPAGLAALLPVDLPAWMRAPPAVGTPVYPWRGSLVRPDGTPVPAPNWSTNHVPRI